MKRLFAFISSLTFALSALADDSLVTLSDLQAERVEQLHSRLHGSYSTESGDLYTFSEKNQFWDNSARTTQPVEPGYRMLRVQRLTQSLNTIVQGPDDVELFSESNWMSEAIYSYRTYRNGWNREINYELTPSSITREIVETNRLGTRREVKRLRVEIMSTGVTLFQVSRKYYTRSHWLVGEWVRDLRSSDGQRNTLDYEVRLRKFSSEAIDLYQLAEYNRLHVPQYFRRLTEDADPTDVRGSIEAGHFEWVVHSPRGQEVVESEAERSRIESLASSGNVVQLSESSIRVAPQASDLGENGAVIIHLGTTPQNPCAGELDPEVSD